MSVVFIAPFSWKSIHCILLCVEGGKEISIVDCNGNGETGNVLSMLVDFIIPLVWKAMHHFAVCCRRKEIAIGNCNGNGETGNVLSVPVDF